MAGSIVQQVQSIWAEIRKVLGQTRTFEVRTANSFLRARQRNLFWDPRQARLEQGSWIVRAGVFDIGRTGIFHISESEIGLIWTGSINRNMVTKEAGDVLL